MSTIGTRTFADGSVSNYFTLANEEYVRTLAWGNGWNHLRIGILCAVTGSASFSLTQFSLGLCSSAGLSNPGQIQGVRSNATALWNGAASAGLGWGNYTLTYNAGPPAYFSAPNAIVEGKTGNSYSGGGSNGVAGFYSAVGSGYRGWCVVDVAVTGGASLHLPSLVSQLQYNATMSDMQSCCSNQKYSSSAIIGGVFQTAQGTAGGLSQIYPMDTLSIYWSNTANVLEVYGISVYGGWW